MSTDDNIAAQQHLAENINAGNVEAAARASHRTRSTMIPRPDRAPAARASRRSSPS